MSERVAESVPVTEHFSGLPDSARLWSFGVSRNLSPEERDRVLEAVDGFLEGWKAHGQPLAAARDWLYDRFLLVAVDDRITPPSGCSIDALVRRLKEVESRLSVEIVGGAPVWYRDRSGAVRRVSRAEFKEEAESGKVDGKTPVFDLSLTRVGELRAGRWELPARNSWHARYLPPGGSP